MDSTVPSPPPPPHAPRDFADLARRISSRTTDLFAVALISVALLYLGTRVTQWWRAPPPSAATTNSAPLEIWDHPARVSVKVLCGDWSLDKLTVSGTAESVTASAIEDARRTLAEWRDTELPPPDPAESQWRERLHEWTPVEKTGNGGKVYVLGGPWPWIAATIPASSHTPDPSADSDAPRDARVVCWTFALPQADRDWTLYVARRSAGAPVGATDEFDVPLPDDVWQLLHARSDRGGMILFTSDASPSRTQTDWENQLTSAGWIRSGDWSDSDEVVHAAFQHSSSGRTLTLDATLTSNVNGQTRGIAEWQAESKFAP